MKKIWKNKSVLSLVEYEIIDIEEEDLRYCNLTLRVDNKFVIKGIFLQNILKIKYKLN